MTPLESRVLDALHARSGRKVYELAAEVGCEVRGVESALRLLERSGFVTRAEDSTHVMVWLPTAVSR